MNQQVDETCGTNATNKFTGTYVALRIYGQLVDSTSMREVL